MFTYGSEADQVGAYRSEAGIAIGAEVDLLVDLVDEIDMFGE